MRASGLSLWSAEARIAAEAASWCGAPRNRAACTARGLKSVLVGDRLEAHVEGPMCEVVGATMEGKPGVLRLQVGLADASGRSLFTRVAALGRE